ncbi:MAG: hypothetical protein HY560_01075 [Gemmatimonadetes bacterium]|nr:hypothetical protein [Gemmatimonadota bacterium]
MYPGRVPALVAVLAGTAACSDSAGISIADLAGTWNAQLIEVTNKANASQKVNVGLIGAAFTITVDQSGRYSASFTIPGRAPESESGTARIEQGLLILHRDAPLPERSLMFTLDGNTLTVTDTNAEFDFNSDGVNDPAVLVMVLRRQNG